MIQFKNKHLRGQREGTRSTAVIDRVHERARAAAPKYRAARVAHLELAGVGDWEVEYRVLNDADIRGFQDAARLQPRKGRLGTLEDDQVAAPPSQPEEEPELVLFNEVRTQRDGTGETRKTVSWIWTAGNSQGPDDHSDDIYRSEWAKTRARAHRAKEEVMLLKEEMRRTLAFLEHRANWWRNRPIKSQVNLSKDMAEALSAYSLSQADLQDKLAAHFRKLWKAPLDSKNDDNDWEMGEDEDESDGGETDAQECGGTGSDGEEDEDC